jgi:hypothetical protein
MDIETVVISLSFIILVFSGMINYSEAETEDKLSVFKSLNLKEIYSSDILQVNLGIRNNDTTSLKNISISENIPGMFYVFPNEKESSNTNNLNFAIPVLKGQFGKSFTYFLKLKNEINSTTYISLPPAEIIYTDSNGTERFVTSEPVQVKINPVITPEWNLSPFVLLVMLLTFLAGFIGAGIHWANMKPEEKAELGANAHWKHALFGGAAGIIVFTTAEMLSALFSDHILKLDAYTIAFLIGASITAGFAPQFVIANATAKFKKERDDAVEDAKEEELKAKVAGSGVESLEKEQDKNIQKLTENQEVIQTLKEMVLSLQNYIDQQKRKIT